MVLSCGKGDRRVIRSGFAQQGLVKYNKTKGPREGVLEKD